MMTSGPEPVRQSQERIKDKDRLAIIAEYIKTKVSRDGFSVTEGKDGKYRVRRIKSEVDKLNMKRDRLRKQLEEVESLIAKGESITGAVDESHDDPVNEEPNVEQ